MINFLSKFIVKKKFHVNVISYRQIKWLHNLIDEAKFSMINYGRISNASIQTIGNIKKKSLRSSSMNFSCSENNSFYTCNREVTERPFKGPSIFQKGWTGWDISSNTLWADEIEFHLMQQRQKDVGFLCSISIPLFGLAYH